MLERHRITTFGISPTAIRLLMRGSAPARYDLDSLRLLGSTGEPWDEKSWRWFFERGGAAPLPGHQHLRRHGDHRLLRVAAAHPAAEAVHAWAAPRPGMATEVFDEDGRPVRGRKGYLVCTKPAPSMTRGVWGDPQRYLETYWSRWPGVWYHGDWASVDEDGFWFLHGRADESMNVAGRKVGPAEVEDALCRHPAVAEAAVIGVPDEIKGEAIVAFVVPRPGCAPAGAELCAHVAEVLGAAFRPRAVETVRELPKTQSGKVVRRLIRQQYLGEALGDLSTVANPEALG